MQRSDYKTRIYAPIMTYQNPDWAMAMSLNATCLDLCQHGMLTEMVCMPPNCYIGFLRTMAAALFLRSDCTHLFFIDTDIIAPANALRQLVEHDRDIVFGPYPKKKMIKDDSSWPVSLVSGLPDERGLLEAYLVATGFLLIKREVIERLYEKHKEEFSFWDKQMGDVVDLFPVGLLKFMPQPTNGKRVWWGEDYVFSVLARQAGFKIWIDPNIKLAHVGRQVWHGDFTEMRDPEDEALPDAAE